MMRSGRPGRLSKKTPPIASIKNTIKDIPIVKMSEIAIAENRDITIFQIRDELINDVLDKCNKIYLEKQSVLFTGYCAYLAWKQLFQWAFFPKDPGEIDYTNGTKWIPDKPPEPSPRDTWAGYAVPIIRKPKVENKYAHVSESDLKDPCEINEEQAKNIEQKDIRSHCGSITSKGKRLPKEKSETMLEQNLSKKKQISMKSISSIQRNNDRSTFTKIKTMPFDALPVPPLEVANTIQAIDKTVPKLFDPQVSAPRKIQHESNGPFRFVSLINVLLPLIIFTTRCLPVISSIIMHYLHI